MTDEHLSRFLPQRIARAGNNFDYCPLDGDTPLLQFINTLSKRGTMESKNYLKSYSEFLIWSYEIRLIDEDTFGILEMEMYYDEHAAERTLSRALTVRENFYLLVDHLVRDEPVPPLVLDELNLNNEEAGKHTRYGVAPYGLALGWHNAQDNLAFPLWLVIKSALEFLTSGGAKYIKECRCGHLYLDATKNRNRRSCNPITCGVVRRSKKYLERLGLVN